MARNREVTDIEIERIIILTNKGESRADIARILNRSKDTIYRYQIEFISKKQKQNND
jgi:transposase